MLDKFHSIPSTRNTRLDWTSFERTVEDLILLIMILKKKTHLKKIHATVPKSFHMKTTVETKQP